MYELHPDTVVHPVYEGWPDREERLRPRSVAFPDSLIHRLDALVEQDGCHADSRSEAIRLACRAWIADQETRRAAMGAADDATVSGYRSSVDTNQVFRDQYSSAGDDDAPMGIAEVFYGLTNQASLGECRQCGHPLAGNRQGKREDT